MPIVSQSQFAKFTGYSAPNITKLIKDGLPVLEAGKSGRATKIDSGAAIQWLLERERQKGKPKHSDPRNALYEEQRRKVWLENEATEHQLVKLEDVQILLNETMVGIASELEGLPGRKAGELAGITDPALVRQALRVEITNIRQAAADRFARLGAIKPGSGDTETAAAKKPRSVGKRKANTAPRKRRTRAVSK